MAHKDLEKLLNIIEDFAKKHLKKSGEFYPIAATIDNKGKESINSYFDGEEYPNTNDYLIKLKRSLKIDIEEKNIVAIGICTNVSINKEKEKSDALQFALEHHSGESLNVYVPYNKNLLNIIKYGEIFAEKKKNEFFNVQD